MPHPHPLWWDPESDCEAMCLLQLPSWKVVLWLEAVRTLLLELQAGRGWGQGAG